MGPSQMALGFPGQPMMAIPEGFLAWILPAEPILAGSLHAEAEGEGAVGEQPLGQRLGEDRFHAAIGCL